MKIHIMGASCAGSTTLGRALSARLGYPYFDTDDYFWQPSEPPFTVKRSFNERVALIKTDIAGLPHYVIGGSLINWGDEWKSVFDLVIFLYVPPYIRMQRLKDRELARYGDVIYTDPERIAGYEKFLAWAKAYDTNAISGRTLQAHEAWLAELTCPVLEIRGDTTVKQRLNLITSKLKTIGVA
jgi:adenylate kinase family enzyme